MEKLNLAKYINYAINEYRANGLSERFEQYCQQIIESQNAKYNIKFTRAVVKVAEDMDVLLHGKVVLEFGTAEDNYDFARMIKGADTRAHREKIIESNSVEYNLYCGKSIELKDGLEEEYVNKHGAIITKHGGPMFNYEFINKNKIANLDKNPHTQAIFESGSSLYNLKVAKKISGIDIEPHSLIVAKYGTADENFKFLSIDGCNTNRHLMAIVKSNDVITNLRCLVELPVNQKTLAKHLRVVFNGSDNEAKYEAAVWANRKKILRELINYMPEIGDFVQGVKSKTIIAGRKEYRFLKRDDLNFNK